ncbi:MAG: branched-chain amino acid ABC transporter permease [Chloroflexota bacterium]
MAANIRPSGVFDTSYAQDISINRTLRDRLSSYILLGIVLLLPVLADAALVPNEWIGIIMKIAIFAIAVQGLNILMGYTGQISLGQAAFMAVGAYTSAVLVRELGFSFWTALPTAALFTGFIGLLFGLPSLRVKGFYLAMATLAAQYIILWLISYPLTPITNGVNPLPLENFKPVFFGTTVTKTGLYYIIIPLAVVMFLAARNIARSRTGRAFISVRDNDLAAELLGINVFRYKLQAFFLSSLYAGVAGVLLAFNEQTLIPSQFPLLISIELLAMLVIGGAGYPLGPLFGAAFILILNQSIVPQILQPISDFLRDTITFLPSENIQGALTPLLFGIILALFLIIEPRGIAYRWELLKISWKLRPYSY